MSVRITTQTFGTAEALRVILRHEGRSFTEGAGAGGWLVFDIYASRHEVDTVLRQWSSALAALSHALSVSRVHQE